jgi:hypothetical protein
MLAISFLCGKGSGNRAQVSSKNNLPHKKFGVVVLVRWVLQGLGDHVAATNYPLTLTNSFLYRKGISFV